MTPDEQHRGRLLLRLGTMAGPLYVIVGVLQVLLRDGFDIRRHALSLASNGSLGWTQVGSFIGSGLLVVVGAIGLRHALSPGRGSQAGPLLLIVYGVGLIGAGIFAADPMDGFPPGTAAGPPLVMSWHGSMHFVAGGIGFFGLIGATWVLAARAFSDGERGWGIFSLGTGLFFLAAFGAIASGRQDPAINLAFTAAVLLSWLWHSGYSAHIRSRLFDE